MPYSFLDCFSKKLSELTHLKWVLFPLILEEVRMWSRNDHDCKMKERLLGKKNQRLKADYLQFFKEF